jgi:hypothetical protein
VRPRGEDEAGDQGALGRRDGEEVRECQSAEWNAKMTQALTGRAQVPAAPILCRNAYDGTACPIR